MTEKDLTIQNLRRENEALRAAYHEIAEDLVAFGRVDYWLCDEIPTKLHLKYQPQNDGNYENKVIERIKCAPAVHEPTKSEFKRMAVQMGYVPVVHGQWILRHIGAGHYWECSVCHTNPCIYVTEHTKFCPNCGARMDEGED